MKIEGGAVSKNGNPDVQHGDRSLDTTQDSSGLSNHIVIEDKDELPSCIFNSTFNDILNSTFNTTHSSERSLEASHLPSPWVSMHVHHGKSYTFAVTLSC